MPTSANINDPNWIINASASPTDKMATPFVEVGKCSYASPPE